MWLSRITAVVDHRDRLDRYRPCVYMVNHTSFIDIWALLRNFPARSGSSSSKRAAGAGGLPPPRRPTSSSLSAAFAGHDVTSQRRRPAPGDRLPRGTRQPTAG